MRRRERPAPRPRIRLTVVASRPARTHLAADLVGVPTAAVAIPTRSPRSLPAAARMSDSRPGRHAKTGESGPHTSPPRRRQPLPITPPPPSPDVPGDPEGPSQGSPRPAGQQRRPATRQQAKQRSCHRSHSPPQAQQPPPPAAVRAAAPDARSRRATLNSHLSRHLSRHVRSLGYAIGQARGPSARRNANLSYLSWREPQPEGATISWHAPKDHRVIRTRWRR